LKILFICLVISIITISISSCERDEIITDPTTVVNPSKGAYIISEGTFSPGTSKLSFYNNTTDSFYVSIFNPGSLGITPDGMIKDGNDLYITEQGSGASGKIYKTDTNGTVIASANVGVSPYSLTISNNKIYITNGPANNVSVVDKTSLSTLNTVNVGLYPQEILAIGNRVFVCNTSVFGGGTDSTVSVIDATSDTIVATIKVGKTPSSLAISTDGKLLVGCPGDIVNAVIYKIDPASYNKIDSFKNLSHGFCKDIMIINSGKIIFIGGDIYAEGTIESYDLSSGISTTIISKPINDLNYGLAYNSNTQQIYVGIAAANFTSSGKFRIYNSSGVLRNEFPISTAGSTGVGPRRIVIKN